MAKKVAPKKATKKATKKQAAPQEKLPGAGTDIKKEKGSPIKLRAEQMAKDSEEYLSLVKERARIEERLADLRKKRKTCQTRLDELAYQLAFGIQDPQLRLDEVVSEATEEAQKQETPATPKK